MRSWSVDHPQNWRACLAAMLLASGWAMAEPMDTHAAGRAIYNFRCYFCHGYSGNARTLAATYLNPPPTDFTRARPDALVPSLVAATLESGRTGTAMQSFRGILTPQEMRQVAAFVVSEFVQRKAPNTLYHTAENGWSDHARYRIAFPFALGEIPLSRPWESLTREQASGKRLYLASCVTCHDHGVPDQDHTGQAVFQRTR